MNTCRKSAAILALFMGFSFPSCGRKPLSLPDEQKQLIIRVTITEGENAGNRALGFLVPWRLHPDLEQYGENERLAICRLPDQADLASTKVAVERLLAPEGGSTTRRPAEIVGTAPAESIILIRFKESIERALDSIPVLGSESLLSADTAIRSVSLVGSGNDTGETATFPVATREFPWNRREDSDLMETSLVLGTNGTFFGFPRSDSSSDQLLGPETIRGAIQAMQPITLRAPESIFAVIEPEEILELLGASLTPRSLFEQVDPEVALYLLPDTGNNLDVDGYLENRSGVPSSIHRLSLPPRKSEYESRMDGEMLSFVLVAGKGDSLETLANPATIYARRIARNMWKFTVRNVDWVVEKGQHWTSAKERADRRENTGSEGRTRWQMWQPGTRSGISERSAGLQGLPPGGIGTTPTLDRKPSTPLAEPKETFPEIEARKVAWDQEATSIKLLRNGNELLAFFSAKPFARRYSLETGEERPLPVALASTDRICGSAEQLYVLRSSDRKIERYDLDTLSLQESVQLDNQLAPQGIAIGHRTRLSPLFLATARGIRVHDPETLSARPLLDRRLHSDLSRFADHRVESAGNGYGLQWVRTSESRRSSDVWVFQGYEPFQSSSSGDGQGPSRFFSVSGNGYRYAQPHGSKTSHSDNRYSWTAPSSDNPSGIIPSPDSPVALAVFQSSRKSDAHAQLIPLVESGKPIPLSAKFALPEIEEVDRNLYPDHVLVAMPSRKLVNLTADRKAVAIRELPFADPKQDAPPQFLSFPSDLVIPPGSEFSYQPVLDSASREQLTFSVSPPLPGARFDPATGNLQWTPGRDFPADSIAVTLTCRSGDLYEATQTFLLQIDAEPVARFMDFPSATQVMAANDLDEVDPREIPAGVGVRPRYFFSETPIESLHLVSEPGNLAVIKDMKGTLQVVRTDTAEAIAQKPAISQDAILAAGTDCLFSYSESTKTLYRLGLPSLEVEASHGIDDDWNLRLFGASARSTTGPVHLVLEKRTRTSNTSYQLTHRHLTLDPTDLSEIKFPKIASPIRTGPYGPFMKGIPIEGCRQLGVSDDGRVVIMPEYFLVFTDRISTVVKRDSSSSFYFMGKDTVFHPSATCAYHQFGLEFGPEDRDQIESITQQSLSHYSFDSTGKWLSVSGDLGHHFDLDCVGFYSAPEGRPLMAMVGPSNSDLDSSLFPDSNLRSTLSRFVHSDFLNRRLAVLSGSEKRIAAFYTFDADETLERLGDRLLVTSRPDPLVIAGQRWEYQVEMNHPDQVESFQFTAPIAGMSIDETKGLISYDPAARADSEAKAVTVRIGLKDGRFILHEFVVLIIGRAALTRDGEVAQVGVGPASQGPSPLVPAQ